MIRARQPQWSKKGKVDRSCQTSAGKTRRKRRASTGRRVVKGHQLLGFFVALEESSFESTSGISWSCKWNQTGKTVSSIAVDNHSEPLLLLNRSCVRERMGS